MTGKHGWRFSLWPVLAFLAVLPGLLALGIWQMQRGEEKSEMHARFATAMLAEARDLTELSLAAFDSRADYERVALRGTYMETRQFLLDNMPRDGRPGHHVLTPFIPEGSEHAVIVDRGWRPGLAQDADAVPAIPDDVVYVEGMLAPLPQPALRLQGIEPGEGWPKVMQFPDASALARALRQPVAEARLLLSETAAEGFQRDWRAPGMPAERHYAYAFQWFALAVALTVIFIVLARPRRRTEDELQ